MTHIRAATLKDAEALSRIGADTFPLACATGTPREDIDAYIESELTARRFEEHIACSTKSLHVAEVNLEIVGYLMLCREEAPADLISQRPLELRRLYVLPNFHGSDVASDLVAFAAREASVDCHDTLWLGVSASNKRGFSFYQRNDFLVAGKCHFPLGAIIYEGFLMSRTLSPDNSFKPMPLRGSA